MAMTMLQMAGATPTPATMADGILLIIDAQREYTDGLMPLPGVQPAIEALAGPARQGPQGRRTDRACAPPVQRQGLQPLLERLRDRGAACAAGRRDDRRQGPAQRLRRHRPRQALGGERPQEPDRRRLHDPHVRVGDGALGDRQWLHEHRSPPIPWPRATCPMPPAARPFTADAINRITLAALSDRFAWIVAKAGQIA